MASCEDEAFVAFDAFEAFETIPSHSLTVLETGMLASQKSWAVDHFTLGKPSGFCKKAESLQCWKRKQLLAQKLQKAQKPHPQQNQLYNNIIQRRMLHLWLLCCLTRFLAEAKRNSNKHSKAKTPKCQHARSSRRHVLLKCSSKRGSVLCNRPHM